ncbi:hypothetical protein BC829DRAFT_409797 [Chytridium lagenaria]|nr:hypothetical protein BC829DRAFT_409797 [Chytridium lagenaria]
MDGLPTIEDKDDEEVKGNVRKMSLKFKNVAVKKKSYHLDIHTKDVRFYFFSRFHGDEIHQMVKALGSVSFVQNVLKHSADLTAVIEALTSDNQPQRIVDMERLFHSCRIEIEVTKEAIFLLRKTWHTTQSESVKLKVLSVVDRLLDRVVMRQGDGNFGVTFKWLKHLEETVAESLKLIIHLVRRAKMIQIEPLSPIVRNQCNALFDSFNEHIFLQTFFDDTEEHGIPF